MCLGASLNLSLVDGIVVASRQLLYVSVTIMSVPKPGLSTSQESNRNYAMDPL